MQLFLFSHRIKDNSSMCLEVEQNEKRKKEDEQLSLSSLVERIYRTELIVAIAALWAHTHIESCYEDNEVSRPTV